VTAMAVGTRCAWCGAPLDAAARRRAGRTECARCGAATIDPWPTPEELERAYGDWYRPSSGRRFSVAGDALLRRTRGALARRVDAIAPPGPVLDVGAGDGVLLDALARRGRTGLGLERAPVRDDIRDLTVEEAGDGWAAIVFWHSLEHLPEPAGAIDAAAAALAPGGVLVVAVPNTESLQARAFGDRWLHLDPPRHLVHLPAGALVARLRERGLQVERVSHLRGGQLAIGWLDGLVGMLPGDRRLYQALRRAGARSAPLAPRDRAVTLAAGAALAPVALACAAAEVALRRGGTVHVEARRA
jgi:SAM-dependent methyltransferase